MYELFAVQEGEDFSTGPFEDEETRALYESLPDIRAVVPALLLGTTELQQTAEEEGAEQAVEVEASVDIGAADAAGADSKIEASQEITAGSPYFHTSINMALRHEAAAGLRCHACFRVAPTLSGKHDHFAVKIYEAHRASSLNFGIGMAAGDEGPDAAARPGRAEVEAIVACLPTLSSREECDELAVNFCYVNSKGARKRMVGPILRLRPQLALRQYCRLHISVLDSHCSW